MINKKKSFLNYITPRKILTCDSSQYGVGAVLISCQMSNGTEKPVAYASRTLLAAEKHYS